MSLIAYSDPEKTKIVSAKYLELHSSDADTSARYFCPSPGCEASMIFVRATEHRCAHFQALPSGPHSDGCIYGRLSAYDSGNYDERNFNFRSFMDYLGGLENDLNQKTADHSQGQRPQTGKKPLSTLRLVYTMLKNHAPNDLVGGRSVKTMLLDDRTFESNFDNFYGNRIVEAKAESHWFSEDSRPVPDGIQLNNLPLQDQLKYLAVLHLTLRVNGKAMLFSVYFRNDKTHAAISKRIVGKNGDKKQSKKSHKKQAAEQIEEQFDKPFVVVAGNWQRIRDSQHRYFTIVNSPKQIMCF